MKSVKVSMGQKIHGYEWESGFGFTICGLGGNIRETPQAITCKRCLDIIKRRGQTK